MLGMSESNNFCVFHCITTEKVKNRKGNVIFNVPLSIFMICCISGSGSASGNGRMPAGG